MSNVAENLKIVQQRIAKAAVSCGRNPQDIRLISVSKRHPVTAIRAAFAAGQVDYGENHLQEALTKITECDIEGIRWHFIGALQSNKTRSVAQYFDWVHTVDRLKLAERLNTQRPHHASPLNVCIQVKLIDEPQKTGCSPDKLEDLARAISVMPRLKLRGLMCIPPPMTDFVGQRDRFLELNKLAAGLNLGKMGLDTLSMGMSDDLEAAIAAGSTMVRVGTAVFGPRPVKPV